MPPLYYTFGVGSYVVPSLVRFSFFCIFPQNGVSNPDVLNCCWYAGDSQMYSSNPKFPQSLDLYFYYPLNISIDLSIWTQVMSPTKCVPPEFLSWWPSQSTQAHQLETFLDLNSFLYLTSQHITSFPLQQSFLNLALSLPFTSNSPEPGIWSHCSGFEFQLYFFLVAW